jgi:hypothetical protein
MPSSRPSFSTRILLLALVGLLLLGAPAWAPPLHLDDPTYRYERVEVTASNGTIEWADRDAVPGDTPISEEIGCSDGFEARICAFEQRVLEEGSVPSALAGGPPDQELHPGQFASRYTYVRLDRIYAATYRYNTSRPQTESGAYRIDATLEPADPTEALQAVSLSLESPEVLPVVAEAARNGAATAPRQVPTPDTTLQFEGSYYRVFQTAESEPPWWGSPIHIALVFGGPLAGVVILIRLHQRLTKLDQQTLSDS